MKPLSSQLNMKINDFYLPLLPVIGTGRLYITSEGHACHAYFREVSGHGIRFTLTYSGYEGRFWISEELRPKVMLAMHIFVRSAVMVFVSR